MQLLSLLVLVMTIVAARAYHIEIATDETSFLQVGYEQVDPKAHWDTRDLVMMHVPFNFGHTIESVAMLPPGPLRTKTYLNFINSTARFDMPDAKKTNKRPLTKAGGENWGGANPSLQTISSITGCPMYLTPQKYWPTELAKTYFGNKHVFGVLRDPYERLVQLFKSGMEGYSDRNATALAKCDVNSAVRKMINESMHGNVFRDGCVFVPQAEYFEGPYRIKLPVNSREFPASMNNAFESWNYTNMKINMGDVTAEPYCQQTVWAESLDCETRKMVREFYSRDFELICAVFNVSHDVSHHFNFCSNTDSICTINVPGMCPEDIKYATDWDGVASGC